MMLQPLYYPWAGEESRESKAARNQVQTRWELHYFLQNKQSKPAWKAPEALRRRQQPCPTEAWPRRQSQGAPRLLPSHHSPQLTDHLSPLSEGLGLQTILATRQVRMIALFHYTQRTKGPVGVPPGGNSNHALSRQCVPTPHHLHSSVKMG